MAKTKGLSSLYNRTRQKPQIDDDGSLYCTVHAHMSSPKQHGTGSFPEQILASVFVFFRWIVSLFKGVFQRAASGPTITLDTGRQVQLGEKIAEGGFSYVFSAQDNQQKLYALKQIRCPERHMLQECREEAAVHRAAMGHPNILPLLGFAVIDDVAWMLFPRMNRSLRAEINYRILDREDTVWNMARAPWTEVDALNIFLGIARGIQALHNAHYSHRDCKVENVMFEHPSSCRTPVIMDFGSAGPLKVDISTRREVLRIIDTAASQTTMPYRPPELFEGGIRPGDPPLDYTKVDVWSLGCTFFAVLYGASPCESEFARSNGRLRIVECSQLKVLGGIPKLPSNCLAASWYSKDILNLIEQMMVQDRHKRPPVAQIILQLETLIRNKGGQVMEIESNNDYLQEEGDDFNSLLNSNRGFP